VFTPVVLGVVLCDIQGMFRETWQLNTVPAANDSMQVRVTLKGVATSVDEGESRSRNTSWCMSTFRPRATHALMPFFKHPPACCSYLSDAPIRQRLEARLQALEAERAAAAAAAAEVERLKPPPPLSPEEQMELDVRYCSLHTNALRGVLHAIVPAPVFALSPPLPPLCPHMLLCSSFSCFPSTRSATCCTCRELT
jgi:hypothetical protein